MNSKAKLLLASYSAIPFQPFSLLSLREMTENSDEGPPMHVNQTALFHGEMKEDAHAKSFRIKVRKSTHISEQMKKKGR